MSVSSTCIICDSLRKAFQPRCEIITALMCEGRGWGGEGRRGNELNFSSNFCHEARLLGVSWRILNRMPQPERKPRCIATLIKTDVCLRDIRTSSHTLHEPHRPGKESFGRGGWRYAIKATVLHCFVAYHRQGRARPARVLEFLDTHLEATEKHRVKYRCKDQRIRAVRLEFRSRTGISACRGVVSGREQIFHSTIARNVRRGTGG